MPERDESLQEPLKNLSKSQDVLRKALLHVMLQATLTNTLRFDLSGRWCLKMTPSPAPIPLPTAAEQGHLQRFAAHCR